MDKVQRAMVQVAIEALRHFAGEIDREQAATLLGMWRHRETLTGEGRLFVLASFRPPTPPAEQVADWLSGK